MALPPGCGLRRARLHLRPCQAFPFAEGQLDDPVLNRILVDGQAHGGARDLHGLARARQRGALEEQVWRAQRGGANDPGDGPAGLLRLMAALRIERNILPALKAAFGVPIGLAVAEEDETMAEHGARNLCVAGATSP